jgi:hypothetical protein
VLAELAKDGARTDMSELSRWLPVRNDYVTAMVFSDAHESVGSGATEEDLLVRNQSYLDEMKRGWTMQQVQVAGQQYQLIKKPVASMNYKCIHPRLYRNVGKIGSLNHLAEILAAPSDWERNYHDNVSKSSWLAVKFNCFRTLPHDETAPNIQAALSGLVISIGDLLDIHLHERRSFDVVGGIFAHSEYDVYGETGTYFINNDNIPVLASEATTHQNFNPGEDWHHDSRSPRVFSTLYSRNAPTILLNRNQWKLFVENENRTAVLTFPYEEEDPDDPVRSPFLKSSLVQMMGTTLLKVICICVLAKAGSPPTEGQLKSPPATPPPRKANFRQEFSQEITEPPVKKARILESGQIDITTRTPTFVSGLDANGEEIRSAVRVASRGTVEAIADAIEAAARKDRADRNKARFS